jgi:hypothetical protein
MGNISISRHKKTLNIEENNSLKMFENYYILMSSEDKS